MNVYSPFDVYCLTGIRGVFERIKCFPKTLKWAYQRMMRGFSDYDVLDLDGYLELLLPSMIETFKNKNDGSFPTQIQVDICNEQGIDYNEYIERSWKEQEEIANQCLVRWLETLDRIIYCFKEANKDTSTDYKSGGEYKSFDEYEFAMRKEGLELINKYFHSLWY